MINLKSSIKSRKRSILTVLLILAFIWSLLSVNWKSDLIHAGGVIGFIGTGGLGMEFKLAMSYFKYSEITLILICYMILVILADLVSEWSRKLVE